MQTTKAVTMVIRRRDHKTGMEDFHTVEVERSLGGFLRGRAVGDRPGLEAGVVVYFAQHEERRAKHLLEESHG